jgi:hypothetical protein
MTSLHKNVSAGSVIDLRDTWLQITHWDRATAPSLSRPNAFPALARSKAASSHLPKKPVPPVRKEAFAAQRGEVPGADAQDVIEVPRGDGEETFLSFAHDACPWLIQR